MDITPTESHPDEVSVSSGWEHFPHGADIGVHGWGLEPAEAFEQAAVALTAVAVDPSSVRSEAAIDITCEGATLEDLFVEWLNAIIFEMATRQMLFGAFDVTLAARRLTAAVSGESIDPDRHELAVEPKGATYTALRVTRRANGRWDAQCVVDV